jgi:hypothetical protein
VTIVALVALSLGSCRAAVPVRATQLPPPPEARKIDFSASGCARLEQSCARDGEVVTCPRAPFAEGLAGCIDLWEEREICAESYAAMRLMADLDLAGYTDELARLEQAYQRAAAWRWGWVGAALIGGAVAGIGIGSAIK